MASRPVAHGILTDEDPPRLIGGRDRDTGRIVFPMPSGGAAETFDRVPLSREGLIWSWTIQRFEPKLPYIGDVPFQQFAVGYVELANEVIVESRLTGFDFDALTCGLPVSLTTIAFATAPDGATLTTFAFRPAS